MLSTADDEYIAFSQDLCEVIPWMIIVEKIHEHFPIVDTPPSLACRVYEDNQSCIKMPQSNKFTPRTKHIALKYQYFKSFHKVQTDLCPVLQDQYSAGGHTHKTSG